MNILFLCSQNRLRSPTAERVFSDVKGLSVSSAGTDVDAHCVVTRSMLRQADVVFVMEQNHIDALLGRFGEALRQELSQKTVVLDIEDRYDLMDNALIDQLITRVCDVLPGTLPLSDLRTIHPQAPSLSSSCWGAIA